MSMFCYQCEETAKGSGCVLAGVCGKDPTTAALQDLLVYAAKGVAMFAHRASQMGGETLRSTCSSSRPCSAPSPTSILTRNGCRDG